MIFDALIEIFCTNLDTLRNLLPVPAISLTGLGGTSVVVLAPINDGGIRTAEMSPLQVVADAIKTVNWLIPVDQFILVLSFIAASYLLLHAFRGVRWLIHLLRGSGS